MHFPACQRSGWSRGSGSCGARRLAGRDAHWHADRHALANLERLAVWLHAAFRARDHALADFRNQTAGAVRHLDAAVFAFVASTAASHHLAAVLADIVAGHIRHLAAVHFRNQVAAIAGSHRTMLFRAIVAGHIRNLANMRLGNVVSAAAGL